MVLYPLVLTVYRSAGTRKNVLTNKNDFQKIEHQLYHLSAYIFVGQSILYCIYTFIGKIWYTIRGGISDIFAGLKPGAAAARARRIRSDSFLSVVLGKCKCFDFSFKREIEGFLHTTLLRNSLWTCSCLRKVVYSLWPMFIFSSKFESNVWGCASAFFLWES